MNVINKKVKMKTLTNRNEEMKLGLQIMKMYISK